MGVDETLAAAERAIAKYEQQRAAEEEAHYSSWAEDAQVAWDDGQAFYQPSIMLNSVVKGYEPSRGAKAEAALQAICAAGWQLHTWSVAGHSSAVSTIVVAHPLFVRVSQKT